MKKVIRKILTCTVIGALVLSVLPTISLRAESASPGVFGNVLPEKASTFDTASGVSDSGWTSNVGSPSVSLSSDGAPGKSLKMTMPKTTAASYSSAAINIAPYITVPGEYTVTFDYKVTSSYDVKPFYVLIRTDKVYSFSKNDGNGNIYGELDGAKTGASGAWYTFSSKLIVTKDDLKNKGTWNLCLHRILSAVSDISIDNVVIANRYSANFIPDVSSDFETAENISSTGWSKLGDSVENSIVFDSEKGNCLYFTKDGAKSASYHSASFNFAPYISQAGKYEVSFDYKTVGNAENPFQLVIRGDKSYSFMNPEVTHSGLGSAPKTEQGKWYPYTADLTITQEDIANKGSLSICLHNIAEGVTGIYLDNVTVRLVNDEITADKPVVRATAWLKNEAVFVSTKTYSDPYNDVTLDLVLTNGTDTYTVPAFWDGGNIWRARFVCPSAGNWSYLTVCSDTENASLHGRTSEIICSPYQGSRELYKHGFIKATTSKYFTYDDGKPFFYLGDTHWSFAAEDTNNVEEIVQRRVEQGFTVIQSEPIGRKFNVNDGVSQADIDGFRDFDDKFELVAAYGLVHTNAEFFFPSDMRWFISANGGWSDTVIGTVHTEHEEDRVVYDLSDSAKDALRRVSRYWVARYGAYPVMWTLGQEVDNDFYWDRTDYGGHEEWSYLNNPYIYVAQYIGEFDAYAHPLSAHQEYTGATNASGSAFRNVDNHNWYAAQWSQNYNSGINFDAPKDYWNNGQNKPAVLYEGRYCYLWTKDFGARVQGWMAYLNGMRGVAWGGQDTWSYGNTYDEDTASSDGVDTITSDDKTLATWRDSLTYKSTYQLSYMRSFFEDIVGSWHMLTPRFDDTAYFTPASNRVFYICASTDDKAKSVVYFYNFSDPSLAQYPNATYEDAVKTGVLGGLKAGSAYNYIWFDPVNGQIYSSGNFTSSASGTWNIPQKTTRDMVLYVCLAPENCAHANTLNFAARNANCEFYGHGAYTFCVDCNKAVSGSAATAALTAHTPGAAPTCMNDKTCTVCHTVLERRLGHEYTSEVISPDCTANGSIVYTCTRCENTKTDVLNAYGHYDAELAKITGTSNNFIVTKFGKGQITPFKALEFNGNSCVVTLYVFNNTASAVSGVYLAYNWGWYAFPSTSDLTRIPGTNVAVNIPAGTGKTVELTVPRECVISNSYNAATDGLYDSLGASVSYRDMGIRFMFAGPATGDLLVFCIDVTNGGEFSAVTNGFAKCGYLVEEKATLVRGISNIDENIRETVVNDLIAEGYINERYVDHNCQSTGTKHTLCVRCGEICTTVALTEKGGHNYGDAATCTTNEICLICGEIITPAYGHEYTVGAYIAPTCESAGSVEHICTTCGDRYYDTEPALNHATFETARLTASTGRNYLITKFDESSPFKYVEMTGDTKQIRFYVYNESGAMLTGAAIGYNWGCTAYTDENLTPAQNTVSWVSIPSGTGAIVTLTLYKECYYSNASGVLTAGNDSLGKKVSYRDCALKFFFGGTANGSIYVTCLDEPTVNRRLAEASTRNGSDSGELITNRGSVPAAVVSALEGAGYLTTSTVTDCENGDKVYYNCVHCGAKRELKETLSPAGHSYELTVTRPTETASGKIENVCSRCGRREVISEREPLASGVKAAKYTIASGYHYYVSSYGTEITPFEFVDFGDSDRVTLRFYIYNSTASTLTDVAINYNWGWYAYTDETMTEGADSRAMVSIAPGEGKIVELTLYKECFYSNRSGALTDGETDSLGEKISYRDVGIRYMFSGSANGNLFVTCFNDSVVTQMLARTGSRAAADSAEIALNIPYALPQ